MRIGYACLNQTLADDKITVNRGMIRRTFMEKGLAYAGELIVQNLQDLQKVIEWNHKHAVGFYRMSSNMFPWMSEYEFTDLPQFEHILGQMETIGKLASSYDQRLSFHPGPFNVLASANEEVVRKTVKELDQHAAIMDMMGLGRSPFNKINIHIGTTLQGDKEGAMENFCRNFSRLKAETRARLTVENDDKANMYTIKDLYKGVYQRIATPLVFDFHHHLCHPGEQSQEEALLMALSTWPEGVQPVVHYSEPRSLTDKKLLRAHADFIKHRIPAYEQAFDIMIEAKQKECALLQYRALQAAGKLEIPIEEL